MFVTLIHGFACCCSSFFLIVVSDPVVEAYHKVRIYSAVCRQCPPEIAMLWKNYFLIWVAIGLVFDLGWFMTSVSWEVIILTFSKKMIRKCATPQRRVPGAILAEMEVWC